MLFENENSLSDYQKLIHLMPFQEVQLCVIPEYGLLAARL